MRDSSHPKRLTPPRAHLLAVAALVSGVLVAGCGGSSPSQTAATVGAATTSPSNPVIAGSTGPSPGPRGRSRSPSACAPTACPTSQTRIPAGASSSTSRRNHLIARVQSSTGEVSQVHARRRSAQPRATAVGTDDGATTEDRRVHAPARCPAVPRPHGLGSARVQPKPSRVPRDHQLPRSDPLVPGHDRPAVTSLRAGHGRLRRRFPRWQQRPLMK